MDDHQKMLDETKQFLIEALKVPDMEPDDLGNDEPLFGEGLGLDSIDALTLVVAIDKRYGVRVPDAAVSRKHFENVETLATFLESMRNPNPNRNPEPDSAGDKDHGVPA